MIKALENIWNFFGELWQLKKYAPEIRLASKYFDQDKIPKKALEKIIGTARKHPTLDYLFKVSKTYDMILRSEENAKKRDWGYACQKAIEEIGINYEVIGKENISKDGKRLIISNHPHGLLDSILLVRSLYPLINKEGQLKIIVMNQLRFIQGLEKIAIFVHSTVKGSNIGSIRESLKHLDEGGDLAVYPSGRMSKTGLEEYPWENGLQTFVSHSKYVVPMWFSGPDHEKTYNFLAKFKMTEKLRRPFSLREVWDNFGQTFVLNIGEAISSEELKEKIRDRIVKIEERTKKKVTKTEEKLEYTRYLRKKAEELKVAV